MTVGELIEKLKQYPADKPVMMELGVLLWPRDIEDIDYYDGMVRIKDNTL